MEQSRLPECWLSVAPDSDFSLANLPFGIVTTPANSSPHVGVAIGDYVVDLQELCLHPAFDQVFDFVADHKLVFARPSLNDFAALGRPLHRQMRSRLREVLTSGGGFESFLEKDDAWIARAVVPAKSVTMHLPMEIGDYTDFYAGYHHAYNVGCMFRGPDNALQPNYMHLPVGYHGRASSIVVSGTPIRRPRGQILPAEPPAAGQPKRPVTSPCKRLDFELELGCLISKPNTMGEEVTVADAEEHIFGYVLLNDWSARDVQVWEYVPLGPFNSKNFGSTISPWVVLADALEPFRVGALENATELQNYLKEDGNGVFDIKLEVELKIAPEGDAATVAHVSSSNLLWSFPQMIAHHTLGGCPMRTGDLLGSGTISGPEGGQRGSLLEMSDGGKKDVKVGSGARRFLQDGDTVTLRGAAGSHGAYVGFGECAGSVVSARPVS